MQLDTVQDMSRVRGSTLGGLKKHKNAMGQDVCGRLSFSCRARSQEVASTGRRNSHAAVTHCPQLLWQRDALLSEAHSNLPWSLANLSLWTFTQHAPSTPAKARGQVAWQLCCPCCEQKSSVDIAPEAGSITTPPAFL